jgi:hypothetical protein
VREMPFHRYVGDDDDPPDTICPACGVRKDRAIHDQKFADRHGGFQPVEPRPATVEPRPQP